MILVYLTNLAFDPKEDYHQATSYYFEPLLLEGSCYEATLRLSKTID